MTQSVSNVLLITLDSLRYDHGDFLDAARRDAVSFSQAIACGSSTPSSFPAILTSTYPLMYGGYSYLSDERPFIARTLNDAGLTTVGFHSNPHLGRNRNYDAGFDVFNDSAEGSSMLAEIKDRVERQLDPDSRLYSVLRRAWHRFSMTTDNSAYAKASTITDNAVNWFESDWNGERPFFMWLHYMDIHYPFIPPKQFVRELDEEPLSEKRIAELNGKMHEDPEDLTERDLDDLLTLYRGEIRFTDHQISRLLDLLEEMEVLNDTAVIVTADHGEAFGEHDRFGHHPYLYDELLHVPLFMRVPGIEPHSIDKQVSLRDLGPTMYDLLGIETPDSVQGRSVEPLLHGEDYEEDIAIATASSGNTLACRTPEWKCFWRVEDGTVELYDLQNDPEETTDVSDEHPEVVAKYREVMEEHLAEAQETEIKLPSVEETDKTQQRLRDLGYLN